MGETREDYEKWSPHRFAARFKTPMLVIHGEQDFRVPYTEGLQLFTALRRQGVPARLLVFPDEGHWLTRIPNQLRWYEEVQAWLGKLSRRACDTVKAAGRSGEQSGGW